MSTDRIDSIIDLQKVQSEIDITKKGISDLVAQIQSVKAVAINITGAKTAAEFTALNTQLQQNIALTNQSAAAVTNEAAAMQSLSKTTKDLTGTLDQNIRLQARYRIELQSISSELKLLEKTTTNAEKTSGKYRNQVGELLKRQNELKIAQAEVTSSIKNQVKEQNAAGGSVDALRARYNLLIKTFDSLSDAERRSTGGQLIKAEAAQIDTQLKTLEGSTGRFQRNVGNYSDAIVGVFKKGFAGLRTLANIIPGLGLSGIVLLLATSFQTVLKYLGLVNSEVSRAQREQKMLSDVYKEASKSVGEQSVKLEFYRKKLNDTNIPASERVKIAKLYNETADRTNEIDLKQIDNLTLINERITAQNKLILQRAISLAATAKLGEAASSLVDAQLQLELLASKTGVALPVLEKEIQIFEKRNNVLGGQAFKSREAREEQQKLINSTKSSLGLNSKELGQLSNLIEKRNKANSTLNEANDILSKLIVTEKEEKETKDKVTKGRDLAEADRKAEFDLQKQRLEFIIETNEKIATDTKASLEDRLRAARTFYEASADLIILSRDFEVDTEGKTNKEIKVAQEKAGYEIIKVSNKFYDLRLKAKEDFDKKFHEGDEKLAKALEKLLEDGYKRFLDQEKARLKVIEDAGKQRQDILKNYADEEKALYKSLYGELTETITAFFTAQDDRRIHDLDNEITAIDEKRQRDIDFINQTVTNRQDAANQIAIVEAQALADRQTLENKQKQIERNKVNIERLSKIAQIAGDTATSIFSLNAKAAEAQATASVLAANPATAAFAPNALLQAALIRAQIPFILGQAALQLVRLAIPRYGEGGEHGGGLMVVGDAGRHEGVQLPDGTVLKTPATDTLMYAPAGTKIHKDYNKMMLTATVMNVPQYKEQARTDTATPLLVSELKGIKKAIGKIPQQYIQVENLISRKIRGGVNILR